MKRKAIEAVIWVVFAAVFSSSLVFLNQNLVYPLPADIQAGNAYETARVVRIVESTLAPDPDFPEIAIGTQDLEMELLSGAETGKRVVLTNFVTRSENKPAEVGSQMVVSSYDGFVSGMVIGYNRIPVLLGLALFFLALVALFGRMKGIRSLFGLAFALICVIFLFIPLLLMGVSALLAAGITVLLSAVVTLAALNGFTAKTFVAGLSCALCTLAAGLIALAFGAALRVTTLSTPEAEDLLFIAQNTALSLPEILYAGILISATGALIDMTMSIASPLHEIKELNPEMSPKQMWKSGMNIGRDFMGTMTNTLILAFAGSSINTLLIIFMYQMPFVRTINMDLLVVEILMGLSGGCALVLSVPITIALSVWTYRYLAGKSEQECAAEQSGEG